ncbi:MAG: 3-oxoadipate enol-lactonase [Caldimonas sp.]
MAERLDAIIGGAGGTCHGSPALDNNTRTPQRGWARPDNIHAGDSMSIVQSQGAALAVRVDGPQAGPALLLSNSLSSDMSMWDDQIPRLSQQYRVVRYDQRGHGQSSATPETYTIEQLGRDAMAVLDDLGIARAHFCGLSMGGMVGLWLLTHARERIERAVLANTSAHMGPPELWNGRIALARVGGMEATVEPTVKRWFPAAFHAQAPATIERMRNMIRRTSLEGYIGCCEAIRDMDQRESMRAIRAPVRVIVGAQDPATTPEAGRAIRDAIPGATLAELDAAHISNVEQPAAFTRAVEEFLLAS